MFQFASSPPTTRNMVPFARFYINHKCGAGCSIMTYDVRNNLTLHCITGHMCKCSYIRSCEWAHAFI